MDHYSLDIQYIRVICLINEIGEIFNYFTLKSSFVSSERTESLLLSHSKTYRYSPCTVHYKCTIIQQKKVMLNQFITKQWKSSKSGINIHDFNLMQYRKYEMSSYSHINFKKSGHINPWFWYMLCFVKNWFNITIFFLNKCTA